jgi:hypothetical protein
MDYYVACDMGKHVDFTFVTVLARSIAIDPATGWPVRSSLGYVIPSWRIRGLWRLPLRTSYEHVAEFVATVAAMPVLRRPTVTVDATGVGSATLETVRAATARVCPDVEVWGIVITFGKASAYRGYVRSTLRRVSSLAPYDRRLRAVDCGYVVVLTGRSRSTGTYWSASSAPSRTS